MLTSQTVGDDFADLPKVAALMERNFPSNEQMPFSILLHRGGGASRFLAFYEDGVFCGFVSLLTWKDITHILYLAVDEDRRGRGLGSQALELVRREYPGHRIIADIEAPGSGPNREQRLARKSFYLKNGYRQSGISYQWRGEDYEILVQGDDISRREFDRFWDQF